VTVSAPVLKLTLVGVGEPLLRLQKRLSCAASGLGLRLEMEIRKDAAALGFPYTRTPSVLLEGRVALSGLPRTEEIEDWLRRLHSAAIALSAMTGTPAGEQDHA